MLNKKYLLVGVVMSALLAPAAVMAETGQVAIDSAILANKGTAMDMWNGENGGVLANKGDMIMSHKKGEESSVTR